MSLKSNKRHLICHYTYCSLTSWSWRVWRTWAVCLFAVGTCTDLPPSHPRTFALAVPSAWRALSPDRTPVCSLVSLRCLLRHYVRRQSYPTPASKRAALSLLVLFPFFDFLHSTCTSWHLCMYLFSCCLPCFPAIRQLHGRWDFMCLVHHCV